MIRLIDADELKNRICDNCAGKFINNLPIAECRKQHCNAIETIDNAPTVDAVDVVRCKDCKYGIRDSDISYSPYRLCSYTGFGDYNSVEHFCSYGERKADK